MHAICRFVAGAPPEVFRQEVEPACPPFSEPWHGAMLNVCAQVSIIEKRHGMLTMYRDVGGGGLGRSRAHWRGRGQGEGG